jgi:hypothetical protein
VTVQKIYPRTNPAPLEASENANVKPLDGEGLREFLRQDAAMRRAPEGSTQGVLRREPESATQVVTDVNSLVQRVAGVSLTQLQNVIFDLQDLNDFLHSEGERIQGEISNYLQLSQTAMGMTKIIADNVAHWKEKGAGTAPPWKDGMRKSRPRCLRRLPVPRFKLRPSQLPLRRLARFLDRRDGQYGRTTARHARRIGRAVEIIKWLKRPEGIFGESGATAIEYCLIRCVSG